MQPHPSSYGGPLPRSVVQVLHVDVREQLLESLSQSHLSPQLPNPNPVKQHQVLIFCTDSLRTLLLRHVLATTDPTSISSASVVSKQQQKQQKNKNTSDKKKTSKSVSSSTKHQPQQQQQYQWNTHDSFPALLLQSFNNTINTPASNSQKLASSTTASSTPTISTITTRVLLQSNNNGCLYPDVPNPVTAVTATAATNYNSMTRWLHGNTTGSTSSSTNKNTLLTLFIRASLPPTQLALVCRVAALCIQQYSVAQSSSFTQQQSQSPYSHQPQQQHRLIFVPQSNAVIAHLLAQVGLLPVPLPQKQNDAANYGSYYYYSASAALAAAAYAHVPSMMMMSTTTTASPPPPPPSFMSNMNSNYSNMINAFQMDVFVLDTDVLSLEYDGSAAEALRTMHTQARLIRSCVRALLKLGDVLLMLDDSPEENATAAAAASSTATTRHAFPRIQAYGPLAEDVLRLYLQQRREELATTAGIANTSTVHDYNDEGIGIGIDDELEEYEDDVREDGGLENYKDGNDSDHRRRSSAVFSALNSPVAALLLLDRNVDRVTPLVTPLTYEGLIDEVLNIQAGHVHVPSNILSTTSSSPSSSHSTLSSVPDGTQSKSHSQTVERILHNYHHHQHNEDATTTTTTTTAAAPAKANKGSSIASAAENEHEVDEEDEDNDTNDDNVVVAVSLHSSDALYAAVRDQHVEQLGAYLQSQAKALQSSHAQFTNQHTRKQKDLAEIHQFVKQIPVFTQHVHSLTTHIHLAELIQQVSQDVLFREQWSLERSILEGESSTSVLDALEDLIASQYPVWKVFRLLCLQSLCAGGIKSARYENIRRDVVQTYGYAYLLVWRQLETSGFLIRREGLWGSVAADNVLVSSSPFYNLRNALHLIHAEIDTTAPDDIAYVSSGYAPLSVRLIQTALKGWSQGREDILKENLVGSGTSGGYGSSSTSSYNSSGSGGGGGGGGMRFVDIEQYGSPLDLATSLQRRKPTISLGQWAALASSSSTSSSTAATSLSNPTTKKPIMIVFYIGGITYMEIASLRFLSQRPSFPYTIVIVTTQIINGTKLLQSLTRE